MAAAIFLLLSVIISNYHIQINTYDYSENKSEFCRIVLISDLHGREFGKNNKRLINKIASLKPDIICLAGDFIDEDNTSDDNSKFIDFLNSITTISPVYYSYGNHDLGYFNQNSFSFIDEIKSTGCIILEEEYVDIEINKKLIRLGGMFDYAFNQQYLPKDEWTNDSTFIFLNEFTDTDRVKILMCHRPESFIYEDASLRSIDLFYVGIPMAVYGDSPSSEVLLHLNKVYFLNTIKENSI